MYIQGGGANQPGANRQRGEKAIIPQIQTN